VYSYWESLPQATYKIGDEIKDFPIDGMSITVTNFSLQPANIQKNITLSITIRNLASETINFNQSDTHGALLNAVDKYLVLAYTTSTGDNGQISSQYQTTYADWWGITVNGVPQDGFNQVGGNENVQGSMIFIAPGGNLDYTSFSLMCRQVGVEKPLFSVSLE
jgi:hypothetical protein